MIRPILLVGGSPRLSVDAVRYLQSAASGATALSLHRRLVPRAMTCQLLLGPDASPGVLAERYATRADLDAALAVWCAAQPTGVVVMSAAVNDYTPTRVELRRGGEVSTFAAGAKIPSGGEELVIRCRSAPKLIDQLRGFGLGGPIVAFKFEDAATVLASAAGLRDRVGAALVVANSLCGAVQALVADEIERHPDREALLAALADRVEALARA